MPFHFFEMLCMDMSDQVPDPLILVDFGVQEEVFHLPKPSLYIHSPSATEFDNIALLCPSHLNLHARGRITLILIF